MMSYMCACKIIASRSCADAPPALRSTYISRQRGVYIHDSGRCPKPARRPENNYGPAWNLRTIEYRNVSFSTAPFSSVLSARFPPAGDCRVLFLLLSRFGIAFDLSYVFLLDGGGNLGGFFCATRCRCSG